MKGAPLTDRLKHQSKLNYKAVEDLIASLPDGASVPELSGLLRMYTRDELARIYAAVSHLQHHGRIREVKIDDPDGGKPEKRYLIVADRPVSSRTHSSDIPCPLCRKPLSGDEMLELVRDGHVELLPRSDDGL